ncbi:MAG: hypothetical protein ACRDKG_00065 [Actinomycetota bacterium]
MPDLEEFTSRIPTDEQVIARGLAADIPVAVTNKSFVRAAHVGIVSIPWGSIVKFEWWNDTHRWGVRLFHSPIDPGLAPKEAPQWWRPWDQPKFHRLRERLSRETELTFSTDHTDAATALRKLLDDHQIAGLEVPSPVIPQPAAKGELRRAD